jgi:hypothetical protein
MGDKENDSRVTSHSKNVTREPTVSRRELLCVNAGRDYRYREVSQ